MIRETENSSWTSSEGRYHQNKDLRRAASHGTIATTSLELFLRGPLGAASRAALRSSSILTDWWESGRALAADRASEWGGAATITYDDGDLTPGLSGKVGLEGSYTFVLGVGVTVAAGGDISFNFSKLVACRKSGGSLLSAFIAGLPGGVEFGLPVGIALGAKAGASLDVSGCLTYAW